MAVETMQDSLCIIKKTLRFSIRKGWRCASERWALFSLALLLYLLYRSSPGFFAFLLSSSPVIICTALLLGVVLNYGSAQLPEINEDRTSADIAGPKFASSSINGHLKAYQIPSASAMKETIDREASFGQANSNKHVDLVESVPLLAGVNRVDAGGELEKMLISVPSMDTLQQEVVMGENMKAKVEKESKDTFLSKDNGKEDANLFEDIHQGRADAEETTLSIHSSSENVREGVEMVTEPNHQGRLFTDSQSGEVANVSEHKAVAGAAGECKWGRAFSVRQRKKLADIKIEPIDSAVDNQLDYNLSSPLRAVGSHDSSPGFDPDNLERDSPDVSMPNTAPLLDKNEPLLGPDHISSGDSVNHSNIPFQDSQAGSDSNDVADGGKAKNGGVEKKDAGHEPAFLGPADDEKNVMDLGYSEMERNRRLEILMVKRRSRKNIKYDIDGYGVDDLSSFRAKVQPISAPRMNPFADDSEMPGSAPSILHARKSPFDFLTEQSNDSGVAACHNLDPEELMPVLHQGTLFKRQESSNFGRTHRHVSLFKPSLEFNFEEASTSNFQRQFSDKSVSRLSIVSECDTVSSIFSG